MSKYIQISPDDLLKHTKNGVCNLWQVLYAIVCPDGDESKVIASGTGETDSPSMLIVDKEINIIDHEFTPAWAENVRSIEIEGIEFQQNVLINLYWIKAITLNMLNVKCKGFFEVFENFSEIKVRECQFNTIYLDTESKHEFINCIFQGRLKFYKNNPKNSTFNSCLFKTEQEFLSFNLTNINFTNSIFEDKIDFSEAELTNCDFSQTEFRQDAYFNGAVFNKGNIFKYTEFRGQGAFYGVTFRGNPVFHNLILKAESHLYFENLNPEQGDLSIKKFSLTSTIINGRVDFSMNIIDMLDMKDSTIVGNLTRTNFHPKCANWETACLLKNEELKQNNMIRALKYKATEKELYAKWLKYGTAYIKLIQRGEIPKQDAELQKLAKKTNIPIDSEIIYDEKDEKLWEIRFERLSLWLGKQFHNHGQNWGLAFFWTCVSSIVPFVFFYIPYPFFYSNLSNYTKDVLDIFISGRFFSSFFQYFSILEYAMLSDYITASAPNIWIKILGTIWFMIGKIAIPYGVYETIRAFRKFDKI